ncbi:MAG: pseudouridine synthase [Crocinitomicaceae bacterium]|nr:pseudouridine synthase [Crocinitomicaceae bacterium]
MSDRSRSQRPKRTGRSENPNRNRSGSSESEKRGFGSRRSLSETPQEGPKPTRHQGGKKKGHSKDTRNQRGPGRHSTKPKRRPALKDVDAPLRLNKFIANSGVCVRREADILITAGAVTVNGNVVTELGTKVQPTDKVVVEGQRIKPEKKHYLILNKPKNFLGTAGDKQGRRTVMDLVKNATRELLLPVDKMERMDTGLLLFTNDPEMAERMRSSGTKFRQLYHVTLRQKFRAEHLADIVKGIETERGFIKASSAEFIDESKKPKEIGVEMHSNRPKALAILLEHLGYDIERLDRTVLGPLTKKDLPRGHWRALDREELNLLRMSL